MKLLMSKGGSISKELVKRVRQVLEDSWPNRAIGSPLPTVDAIAGRLQAKFSDLGRTKL